MELLPNCYTDVCINGKWFHYDHNKQAAFMLNGSDPLSIELEITPTTEAELEAHLASIATF
ncbi:MULTISPECIES: hypothetical protein [unclassified Shewanella]|uniref:hypothetical protein n=1 Tax=unclassified Shewanella TaxID=196818 RepID=UPI00097040E4|nr:MULTISPECIES: hypothetical protein [unclassified Shewanella]MDO6620986.1 hypothetical protein [Shewanella sp. 6_MG-2023]MDO6641926.1 hypothetical protein [Shewanella sp. 5_MG-2023]MDO6680386.1 hypothetical protein [Shewanella sp. 4_MG-2023]MDO6777401.1 hypothetical protein [Shewanella sp. 3_MG-2023]PMG31316.1 hypothetical protein BCU94_08730 [Shewanella sp. 10N.286.52.C2]